MGDDDAGIMQRVQAGDVERFAVLIERYRRPLLRAAFSRLGDPDWAEDVVQEAFLAAFVSRATYDASYSFRTWLWTILLNLCRRHWKRQARRPAPHALAVAGGGDASRSDEPTTETTALACLLKTERIEQVKALLAELPEEQADALRLRFYGELTFREIAAAMGCHLNTAKSRVRYGLEKLAGLLRRQEGELE